MSHVRALRPTNRLGQVRLASVVFGLLALTGQTAAMSADNRAPEWIWTARAALVLAGFVFVAMYVRGRSWWWEPVLLPALTLGVATTLDDPMASIGMTISVIVIPSLYGSARSWAVRALAAMAVLPLAAAVVPAEVVRPAVGPTGALLSLPQVVLLAVLTRAMYSALTAQERVAAREVAVARAGTRMVVATSMAEIFQIGAEAATELAANTPGVALVLLERRRQGIGVVSTAGLPRPPARIVLPESVLSDPEAEFGRSAPGYRVWRVESMPSGRIMIVGARRRMPAGVLEAIRTLGAQVQLAETRRRSHEQLEDQAHHDHLTRLPTRAKFFRTAAEAVEHDPPGTVALLTVDLDDFKRVNDTYGHAAGDELLVDVAGRLERAAGPVGLAGRLGGDEFVVLLRGLSDVHEAEALAADLCARLAAPVTLTAATVRVGASIGVAMTEAGVGEVELTRRADLAMYSAKAAGKNRVSVFSAGEHGDVARHRTLEDELPEAIGRGDIRVYYQPYRRPGSGAVAGVEALFQWMHPMLGAVDCRELLALAERTGDRADLIAYVLRTITTEVAALDDRLPVGLNIGGHQVLDPRFADAVRHALNDTGLAPDRLILELLESEHLDDPAARVHLRRLTGHGVRLALDDFGTGTVSLAALRTFPVHQLKIAAAFLDDPRTLDFMVSMGALLDAETVVLGVADAAQRARAGATRADAVQGDLIAPVVDAAGLARLLTDQGLAVR